MAVSDQELNTAVAITGRFENAGDPWRGVTGDFDGMGISCGVLQWNIGSASLQPMVKAVGQAVVLREAPTIGADLWRACNAGVATGLAIVRGWQTGTKLKAIPARELASLMGSPEMKAQQTSRIRVVAERADALADSWAKAAGRNARTLRELVWFFDLVTQNGGLKGLTLADVRAFIQTSTPGRADDVVCDWLLAAPAAWWGRLDCIKNAGLWRDKVTPAQLELFALSYLRSGLSNSKARGVVMNRKGALAIGKGWVNSQLFDFSGQI
ncbi:MAG: hypothetical protein ACOVOE_01395 [Caulobacter sp.]